MNVKDFLEQARHLDDAINSQVAELTQLRELSMKISSSRMEEHVSHSTPNEAPFAKWVEQIVDKEKEINAEIDKLIAVKLEISRYIDKIDNPQWQCLLRSRYVLCKEWVEVAEELGYGLSSIYRIHKQIIDFLTKNSKSRVDESK